MDELDDPTVLAIFSFLDSTSLLKIAGVLSKHYYELSRENSLWANLLKREFCTYVSHEEYEASAMKEFMKTFGVAKRYRERAVKYLCNMKRIAERDVNGNSTMAGVCEFIRMVESKRGGLVLCSEGIGDNLEMLGHTIVYMLFRYHGLSIGYTFQGENPSISVKVIKLLEQIEAEIEGRVVNVLYAYDGAKLEYMLKNGSSFLFNHNRSNSLQDGKSIYYTAADIVINFICGSKFSKGSPMFSSMSHTLDDRVWPQEKAIHVITSPNYYGGELNRLWLFRHKLVPQDINTYESLDSMTYIETQEQEHVVIDTKLWLDERGRDDREGFWKKFTILHPKEGECYLCNEFKRQKSA